MIYWKSTGITVAYVIFSAFFVTVAVAAISIGLQSGAVWDHFTRAFIFMFLFPIMAGIVTYVFVRHQIKDSPEVYFKKFGPMDGIKKYRLSNRLFYFLTLLSVAGLISTIFVVASEGMFPLGPSLYLYYFYGYTTLFLMLFSPVILLFIIILVIIKSSRSKKGFDFYLARAYFTVASQNEDETEKLRYLTLSLNAYNEYLEKKLKLKIKNIMLIYSKIMSASADQKIKIRESIGKALEKDKLELARQLAELSGLQDKEEFLTKESAILNLRVNEILTVMIPAVISIVTFILAMIEQLGNPT